MKAVLEGHATSAGLPTKTNSLAWRVANRIIIEELEAWYFGNWDAVAEAYPRVPATIPAKAPFRNSDAIAGGTWEALERILQKAGYYPEGLPKLEVADAVGSQFESEKCTSDSFAKFLEALSDVDCGCCTD